MLALDLSECQSQAAAVRPRTLPYKFTNPGPGHLPSGSTRSGRAPRDLSDEVLDQVPVDIREAEATALEAVSQASVVLTEQMQDRGLQIVDVDGAGSEHIFAGRNGVALVVGHVVAVGVGLAVRDTGLHASARHPDAEA